MKPSRAKVMEDYNGHNYPGIGSTQVTIIFNKKFDTGCTLINDQVQLRVMTEPVKKSFLWIFYQRWEYKVQLVSGDISNYIPLHTLKKGSVWYRLMRSNFTGFYKAKE